MSILFDTNPLVVNPTLAKLIGLNESIVLQQIHYWLEINKKADKNLRDGFYWTYNSYTHWQEQFPFWSVDTIKRTIQKLEKLGLVISSNYNRLIMDRTKWYRIDYDRLEEVKKNPSALEPSPLVQNAPTSDAKCTDHECNLPSAIPESNSESKIQRLAIHKGIAKRNSPLPWNNVDLTDRQRYVIEYYMMNYKQKTGKEHPALKPEQWGSVKEFLFICDDEGFGVTHEVDEVGLVSMIDQHFRTRYKKCDWNILHFCSHGVKVRRMYEVAY